MRKRGTRFLIASRPPWLRGRRRSPASAAERAAARTVVAGTAGRGGGSGGGSAGFGGQAGASAGGSGGNAATGAKRSGGVGGTQQGTAGGGPGGSAGAGAGNATGVAGATGGGPAGQAAEAVQAETPPAARRPVVGDPPAPAPADPVAPRSPTPSRARPPPSGSRTYPIQTNSNGVWNGPTTPGTQATSTTYDTVVLENGYLRVTLLPKYGGRILSIVHKPTNQELLYQNPIGTPYLMVEGIFYYDYLVIMGGIFPSFPDGEHGRYWNQPYDLKVVSESKDAITVRMSRQDDLEPGERGSREVRRRPHGCPRRAGRDPARRQHQRGAGHEAHQYPQHRPFPSSNTGR